MADRIEDSAWVQITITFANLTAIYQRAFEHLSMTVIEAYVLRALYEQNGQRAGDLAQIVGRPPMTFTPILDKLEHKKLIERRNHPSDRRSVMIYLTEAGARLQQPVLATFSRAEKKLHQQISPDQLQSFHNVLRELVKAPGKTP